MVQLCSVHYTQIIITILSQRKMRHNNLKHIYVLHNTVNSLYNGHCRDLDFL